ncbi:cell wall-binding repeat-containing protein [Desulfosporosinus sp. BICA1-9]|uniref:cell wall-binding repeat-containing protein n=1 Tax=Desulfosporosinus sp. BICA1-9 TaxID=1531958 RepID=UPI00054C0268|nr:cell wall-binding repeat-containing protein [Desulfosporosinus sp. BICA1-9]KJS47794.1 MAG: glycosyl hydrolase family 18 [Peptococcaceae bacterium BRH_c23]KJS89922.1 MAG: glycosyl hydrolase family 18 [Desulfosporosinus sp. BICA1-9]HBW35099.1 glycosyl hydrolase family 18 [Desulfosporosinus sp.]
MNFFTKKTVGLLCGFMITLSSTVFHPLLVQAAPTESVTDRIFGNTLYDTAVEISKQGWDNAPIVVLATGRNFPDALTGTVLAQKIKGPLLLTESGRLNPVVSAELKRLGTQEVFLLGGTAALNEGIEQSLKDQGILPKRLFGWDQYGTAAAIAKVAAPSSKQAFLVNGERFPDALSISSYAAAQGIPILLTRSDVLPPETAEILGELGISQVTLIGGKAVIKDIIEDQLSKLPNPVKVTTRYAGYDQYETNTVVLNQLPFDTSTVYVATGENFPDALAGAALAAKSNAPILLLPSQQLGNSTTAYLNQKRTSGSAFMIFGGWGVINYKLESIIRTGVPRPRISLQYTQGGFTGIKGMLSQVQSIPSPATDYADIIAPSWYYLDDTADGNVTGGWDATSDNYAKFTTSVHARNLKVLPVIQSSWDSPKAVDTVMASETARARLISEIMERIDSINADGIVIDFEFMSNSTGPNLTQFMKELYAQLHPLNKLVVQAVMPRTGAEAWLEEFNYPALAQHVDYLHIMTYDYSHGAPGPIAPLNWSSKVLDYARGQGVDMHKILLGIPYYGVDWWTIDSPGAAPSYKRRAGSMTDLLALSTGSVQRDASQIPYFNYSDALGSHTVYYDDAQSWNAKMALLNQYGLAGVGAWSLYWTVDPVTSNAIYPILRQHLR